jgi:hypothetical protein
MMKKNRKLLLVLIVVGAAVFMIFTAKQPKGNIASKPLANFTIDDTAAVDRIFIIDADQVSITLERDPNSRYWDLNSKYKARRDAVELLLRTFKRIKVKSPVPESGRENVIRLLAGAGKKVEIYQGGTTPAKTYIVGNATQDHTGTYMLLETAEDGRSSEPFIVHMEGFTGFLSTRFFTDENEWRYTGVFDYPALEVQRVEMVNHQLPFHSFSIDYKGGNDLKLNDYRGESIAVFDTLRLKDYLLLYKKAHVETYKSHLSPEQEDSLKQSPPAYTLSVIDNAGATKELQLYLKKPVLVAHDAQGNVEPWDLARMYFVFNGEVGLVQLFVFDPLVKVRLSDFAPSKVQASRAN